MLMNVLAYKGSGQIKECLLIALDQAVRDSDRVQKCCGITAFLPDISFALSYL